MGAGAAVPSMGSITALRQNDGTQEIPQVLISDIINVMNQHGVITIDSDDLFRCMAQPGEACIAHATGRGNNAEMRAAEQVLATDGFKAKLKRAKAIILSIVSGHVQALQMKTIANAVGAIEEQCPEEMEIYFQLGERKELGNRIRLTVLATGIG